MTEKKKKKKKCEVSYQGKFLDQLLYSTKLSDEMSVRQNGLSMKWVSTKCRACVFNA